jgi:molecular chaperone DnaK (HSP70)
LGGRSGHSATQAHCQRLGAAGAAERQDLDELCAEVLSELIHRLRQVKASAGTETIQGFSGYTSAIATSSLVVLYDGMERIPTPIPQDSNPRKNRPTPG